MGLIEPDSSQGHRMKPGANRVGPEPSNISKGIEMTPVENYDKINEKEEKKRREKERKRRRYLKSVILVVSIIFILIVVLAPVLVILAKKGNSKGTTPTKSSTTTATSNPTSSSSPQKTSSTLTKKSSTTGFKSYTTKFTTPKTTLKSTTAPTNCAPSYPGDGSSRSSRHSWICSDADNIGSACSVFCTEVGFRSLNPTSSCLANGRWSATWSECIAVNPCELKTNNCSSFATCISNSPGKFQCSCNAGYAGDGFVCGNDTDADGIPDNALSCISKNCRQDNCMYIPNSGQEDLDHDGKGDSCDDDDDNDGILDNNDNCPLVNNPHQRDRESDGVGDLCDNCPNVNNTDQIDTNRNGIGDACDLDADSDGVRNGVDNCLLVYNPDQNDNDTDGIGDVCDNCPNVFNVNQTDADDNLVGDACQSGKDSDSDGIADEMDNCRFTPNGDQTDTDKDNVGDACDNDKDGDGIPNISDNCPLVANPTQVDSDMDGVGDVCADDDDGDGVKNDKDDFPIDYGKNQTDFRASDNVIFDDKGTAQEPPKWFQFDEGRELLQTVNGNPGALIGKNFFGDLIFTGTLMVRSPPYGVKSDDDYVGIIFGFQSNRNFYVCSWKKSSQSYNLKNAGPYPRAYGRKGISLKKFESSTGPGIAMRDALWETGNFMNQSTLLWHDASPAWQFNVSYQWKLVHHPDSGMIRVFWYQGKNLISDSGDIIDKTWRGGRVGVYVFSQENVYFSAMRTKNAKTKNFAIELDGKSSFIDIGNQRNLLRGNQSFTIDFWTRIDGIRNTSCTMPSKINFGTLDHGDTNFFTQDKNDERDCSFPSILIVSSSQPTGPEFDHTSGNGTGLLAYFRGRWNGYGPYLGDRTRLLTPWFPANSSCSVEFYLHMWDGNASPAKTQMGSFQVDVRGVDKKWNQLIWIKGDQNNTWHRKRVSLKPDAKGYDDIQMRFTAVRGHGSRSDIALDDVQFSPGCGTSNRKVCEDDAQYLIGSSNERGLFLLLRRGQLLTGFSTNHSMMTNSSDFKLGDWNHVALAFNSSTKRMALYLNGKLAADKVLSYFNIIKNNRFFIGKQGSRFLKGFLDEIRIWKKEMAPEELKRAAARYDFSSLHSKYSLDDGEGLTARDSAVHKKNAVVHNGAWMQSFLPDINL